MANLLTRIRNSSRANETVPVSIYDWAKMFRPGGQVNYQGRNYQGFTMSPAVAGNSSIVYTCERLRVSVFAEARFAWQRMSNNGRPLPQAMFGNSALGILETPWRGAQTRDLLATMEMDAAQYGNSYWIDDTYGNLVRLDPNTVRIITRAVADPITGNRIGETLDGYSVTVDRKVSIFSPEDICHYKPIPSANSQWVGQSWISACLPDIDSDALLTQYKKALVENGANLSYVVNMDPSLTPTQFDDFVAKYKESHRGPMQAGETLFLQGGSDVKTVGQTFEQIAYSATQGAGETRIAACAGTHPVVLGLSEGLSGSALNAGNYAAAKRNFADGTMANLWGSACGALASIIKAPSPDSRNGISPRLWYDSRDIPFLRDDAKDLSEIFSQVASSIRTLTDGGYTSESVVQAANEIGRAHV